MKNGKLQVKDISDEEVYKAIDMRKEPGDFWRKSIYDVMPYPTNLITAKLNKMEREDKIAYGVSIAYPFRS